MSWEPAGSQTIWSALAPNVHVNDHDDGATITVDMPGVGEEDLDLTLEAGTLLISGKRGDRTYAYRVSLGDAIDPNRIEASLDKGVLTIEAHKRPEAKPRKIELKTGSGSQKSLKSG